MEANAANKRSDEIDRIQHEHLRAMIDAQNLKIETLEQRIEFSESLLEARASNLVAAERIPHELT